MTRVNTFDDSFELLEEETILEGLERHGYQIEYQCRAGYCGSCKTKLLMGKVSYKEEPLAFIDQNEILPCCCRPSGNVTLDIDSTNRAKNPCSHEEQEKL